MTIPGGFYLKARCIQESWIAHAAPVVREIWDYLLREANHKPKKFDGFVVERGQLFRTYKEIREALHWKVGYRKQYYSEAQTKDACRALRKQLMITTTKQPRGVLINICNYKHFQSPKNYETTNETTSEATNEAPHFPQTPPSINKNVKNDKNVKKNLKTEALVLPEFINPQTWQDFLGMRKARRKEATPRAQELLIKKLGRFREQGQDPNEILEQSIINSWAGVWEVKDKKPKPIHGGAPRPEQREQPKPITPKSQEAKSVWEVALEEIKPHIEPDSFETWLEPTVGYDLRGNTLLVAIPNPAFGPWIQDHYADEISKALPGRKVEFVVVPEMGGE